jgi:hypothetical protein
MGAAMPVVFVKKEAWNGERDCVSFAAELDGTTINCMISLEALQDNFGGSQMQPLDCFRENRKAIEAKAEALLYRKRFEDDGSILIRSQDGA